MAYQEITPRTYPIQGFVPNDDWIRKIPVIDLNGNLFDFSEWQGAKASVVSPSGIKVAEFNTTDGTIELSEGSILLKRLKADTNIPEGLYYWDCEFIDPEGLHRTLILSSEFHIGYERTNF